jgi:hypothetical protein
MEEEDVRNSGSSRSDVTEEFDDDENTLVGPMDDEPDGETNEALRIMVSHSSRFFDGVLLLRSPMSTAENSLMGLEKVMVAQKIKGAVTR